MKTLYYVLAFVITAGLTNSCITNSIKGNGNIIEKELSIEDYQDLSFSGKGKIIYEQKLNEPAFLKIEIDDNLYSSLKIKNQNGKLTIERDNKINISPTKFIIHTNSSSLSKIDIAGSVNCQLKGNIEGKSLIIETAGSTNITSDSLCYSKIKIDGAGSSDVKLRGKVLNLICDFAGSSSANLYNLKADNVNIDVAGSATLEVYANKTLNIDGAGSCSVRYGGNPQIKQSISGSGSVKKID